MSPENISIEAPHSQKNPAPKSLHYGVIFGVAVVVTFLVYALVSISSVSKNFPLGLVVRIESGATLRTVADNLEQMGIVRSSSWLNLYISLTSGQHTVQAGEYKFDEPISLQKVARRITTGEYGFPIVKVTVPEGLNVGQLAKILKQKIASLSVEEFLASAKEKEGYLFPETYRFPTNVSPQEIVQRMESEFSKRTAPLDSDIRKFGGPFKDVVTMASLLEEEGKTAESRRIISGILWKRLARRMPLQVDATFQYINGKNTYELTTADLSIDSPFNTYKYAGLPPAPISNPGLDSIRAAIEPIESKYFYYLSERNGTIHYAKTYAEHLRNKVLYVQ